MRAAFSSTTRMVRPLARQRRDHLVDAIDHDRREAERGLIQHQQLAAGHQAAPDPDHAALATRQGAGDLVASLLELGQQREHLVEARAHLLPSLWKIGAHLQVLQHRHLREQQITLRHMHDARRDDLVRALAAERLPIELDGAGTHRHQPGDHPQQRGLAMAVRPDDRGQAAFRHVERDAAQHLVRAIAGAEPRERQQRRHAPAPMNAPRRWLAPSPR